MHRSLRRYLPADFIDGEEWMALRKIVFGAFRSVSRPTRERLLELDLIETYSEDVVITAKGRARLALMRF
jgi:hypothetical protein